ncbi:MAG TPA: response regulator, partial [Planctomycetota bacterium]|nr:response regulator [Planctomycetota bacterium]
MKVIYIDDSPEDREILARELPPPEYELVTAASIDEAKEKIKRNGHEAIVTDCKMPGYSGAEAVLELDRFYGIPIIALTGAMSDDAISELKAAGAFDVVFKTGEFVRVLKRA